MELEKPSNEIRCVCGRLLCDYGKEKLIMITDNGQHIEAHTKTFKAQCKCGIITTISGCERIYNATRT